MKTWVKVTLSVVGMFLSGMTAGYQANPIGSVSFDRNPSATIVGWVVAGVIPVGGYLVGFWQLNPRLRKRS